MLIGALRKDTMTSLPGSQHWIPQQLQQEASILANCISLRGLDRNSLLLFNRLGSMLTSCEKQYFFLRNALSASQVGECTCFHPCVSHEPEQTHTFLQAL